MSSELEFLERARRDILTHMQAFPGDSYAAGKLAAIEHEIEAAYAIPPMGHMVNRPSPARKVEMLAKATFFKKDGSVDRVVHSDGRGNTMTVRGEGAAKMSGPVSPCQSCAPKDSCMSCQYAKVPASLDWKFIHSPERAEGLRGVAEAEALNNRLLAESLAKEKGPRYTFGADYEQDQLWLAAERKNAEKPFDRRFLQGYTGSYEEPDRMMFPTTAFNLTSMYNLNYGTSRY